MTIHQFLFIALIVLGASIIQALFGFGFGLISVPLMIFFVDLPTAVVTATAVSTVSCAVQWWESRAVQAREMAQRLVCSALVGMPFGLWLLINLDARLMKGILGVVVLLGVLSLSIKAFDLQRLPKTFDYAMGVISGVLSTATSTNGPPLVFLLHARHFEPQDFRAVLNRVFTFLNFFTLVIFTVAGKMTADALQLALFSIPIMGLGVFIGTRLRSKINPDHFRNLVIGLLTLSGLSAISNALLS
ncbi:MAG: sulfite exporter TauE/SafE family protein [Actinomycetota bacterium]